MSIIDPEGFFNGDRLRRCSNLAQLHWPRLFLASNGFGRLEINYAKIIGRAYAGFKPVPSEADLNSYLREYVQNYLLFVYEFDGQTWGQWDTQSRCLPRFKTSSDRRSPIPPEPDFTDWKNGYLLEKARFPKSFGNISETFRSGVGVGVGVGDGVGEGINTCASSDARQGELVPKPKLAAHPQERWFASWWDAYWLKKAKKDAWRAFQKIVKTEEQFKIVMDALKAQTPEMLQREPSKRPYPATWLNGERWQDQTENQALVIRPKSQDLSSRTLDAMARNLQKYGRIS